MTPNEGGGNFAGGFAVLAVQVQVCGRLETIRPAGPSLRELAVAVERTFEVRPPFAFLDRGSGRLLQDDDSLAALLSAGGVVVVRLTEGVMHDLSRRVDQLRHLQWGHFTEQMSSSQQENAKLRSELRQLRASVEHGHSAQESSQQDWRQLVDACHDLVRQERSARDEALRGIGDRLDSLQLGTQSGLKERDEVDSTLQRAISDCTEKLETERKDREHGDHSLRVVCDELRHFVQSEASARKELAQALRLEIAESRTMAEASQSAWRTEAVDLRQQLAELRSALASEQRDRTSLGSETQNAYAELQHLIAQETADRQIETRGLLSGLQELETTTSTAHQEHRQTHAEVHRRLTTTVDGHIDERNRRLEEVAELTRQFEVLRRSVEHDTQEVERKLGKQFNLLESTVGEGDGVRTREIRDLQRHVVELQEVERKLDKQLNALETSVGASDEARTREIRDLQWHVGELQEVERKFDKQLNALEISVGESDGARTREIRDLQRHVGEVHEQRRQELDVAVDKCRRHSEQGHQGMAARLEESERAFASKVEGILRDMAGGTEERRGVELELREVMQELHTMHVALTTQIQTTHLHVRDEAQQRDARNEATFESIRDEIKNECGNLGKVFSATIAQELQAPLESVAKLRDDCKEAMVREVRSRMEHDAALQEALEHESMAREEAIKGLDEVFEELRQTMLSSLNLDPQSPARPLLGTARFSSPRSGSVSSMPESPCPTSQPMVH